MSFITGHKHRVLRKLSPLKWMFQKLFAESRYNSSLEIIADLPKDETIWWFDHTDMVKAKGTVAKVACIVWRLPQIRGLNNNRDIKLTMHRLFSCIQVRGMRFLSTLFERRV